MIAEETRTELPAEVTQLLLDWGSGDQDALTQLMPLVCDQLRIMARGYLGRESSQHTLQPTALVNEVYLRLRERKKLSWKNRAHFYGFAARTMRRILVDHARLRRTQKRGGGDRPLPIDERLDHLVESQNLDVVALNEALDSLEKLDPRQAEIVNLRFFIGLTVEETAGVLGISQPTVSRNWRIAKRWLYRQLGGRSRKA